VFVYQSMLYALWIGSQVLIARGTYLLDHIGTYETTLRATPSDIHLTSKYISAHKKVWVQAVSMCFHCIRPHMMTPYYAT